MDSNSKPEFPDHSTIVVKSSKENKYYKLFKELLEDEKVKSKLENRVTIFEDTTSTNPEEFLLYMYSPSGQMLLRLVEFSNFEEIIESIEKISGDNNQNNNQQVHIGSVNQVGSGFQRGRISYKHKYEKYKKKYMGMKNIITKFS